ncbi:MAG: hypothetical protein DWC05_01105 [Candidatus Poseidoniales archaeon]|jgi:hypothetical protein|nr:MAG: hypothetical protein DWC05_01105 [Candidatus Poseidoniales archaeon]
MADEHKNEQERRVSVDDMPAEVRQLADAMLGVNPQWNVHDWLVEQANLSMDLLALDLLREKVMIDQRLQRLDDLGRRLESDEKSEPLDEDPNQRNLFDCFDLNEEHALRGLGERATEPVNSTPLNGEEHHPSNIFLDLLPNANTDDPLLAIACQSVIISIELEVAKGEPLATLQAIFAHTRASNIDDSETDEALDHLLTTGMVIEVDDDCFILLPP